MSHIDKLKLTENGPPESSPSVSGSAIRGLTLLMVLAYLTQGFAQHFCLLNQPLNNFLKVTLAYDAAAVACIQAVLMWPWVLKPILGLLCDLMPGRGNGRINYLLAGSVMALTGYLTATLSGLNVYLLTGLLLIGTSGMSLSTVVMVALTAQDRERTRIYLGLQSICYYLANIFALYLGGLLVQRYAPQTALHLSMILAAVPPGLLAVYLLLRYYRGGGLAAATDVPTVSEFWRTLKTLLGDRAFLGTLLFMLFWNFSPSLGVSLYFFETDRLHFSQELIGFLGSISSIGFLCGSVAFRLFLTRTTGGGGTYLMVLSACLVSASYLLLSNPASAMAIEFLRGFTTSIFTLNIYSLAARVTPVRFSAACMAFFLCVYNLAGEVGILTGGYLYAHICQGRLLPLVVVSIITTALAAIFVPLIFSAATVEKINSIPVE